MATRKERERRAAGQRARRLAARACGNCGSPAELMMTWGDGQTLAVCRSCKARLDSQPMEPYCAFYEEPPARFRPDGRGLRKRLLKRKVPSLIMGLSGRLGTGSGASNRHCPIF